MQQSLYKTLRKIGKPTRSSIPHSPHFVSIPSTEVALVHKAQGTRVTQSSLPPNYEAAQLSKMDRNAAIVLLRGCWSLKATPRSSGICSNLGLDLDKAGATIVEAGESATSETSSRSPRPLAPGWPRLRQELLEENKTDEGLQCGTRCTGEA